MTPATRLWTIILTILVIFALAPAHPGRRAAQAAPAPQPAQAEEHTIFLPLLGDNRQPEPPPPLTISVDPGLQPAGPGLEPIGDSGPRPLAALADPAGRTAIFVANELVVQSNSRAAIDALLARYGGEVLLEVDPSSAGLSDLPRTYLLRVDPARGDSAGLVADLEALAVGRDYEASGAHRVSSAAGEGLLAIAAAEARAGAQIGVNWVGAPHDIPGSTSEAAAGPTWGGVPYTPDAYNWTYMSRGSTQDIGVAEAWSLLARSGRLGNRVPIAILDKGFAPNADFPTDMRFGSVIPGIGDPRGVRGDDSSPWHGTHVLVAAAGRADNGAGAAGVAPTADPIAIYTGYDYITSIAAVILARAEGAKVINMSYSANVPAVFSWTVLPFEATTAAVRASGALLFASAGNDSQNVDGQDCFIICWEHTLHTPCENIGVICVGGLGWNSRFRDSGSNYGSGGVQIFAPYTVYRSADPDNPGMDATLGVIRGTSFASPFAAGVAALIWAADPSLSAERVWEIMRDTAHVPGTPNVPRYVNAYRAVLEAVGSGVAPTISLPVAGRTYEQGLPIPFSGSIGYVAARDGIPLDVQWRTQGGRVLHSERFTPGAGSHTLLSSFSVSDLPAGEQTVILRATAGAASAEARVSFSVRNSPPTVSISQPTSGAAVCFGESVTMRGSAFDPNQPTGLPDSAFAWSSSRDGSLGTGPALTRDNLSVGDHTLTLRVTDAGGLVGSASVILGVLAPSHPDCLDLAPTALLTAPADGTVIYAEGEDGEGWYATFTFSGLVGDAEDAVSALQVELISDVEGSLGSIVPAADGSFSVTQRLHIQPEDVGTGGTWHTVTLRVTDSAGNVREDQVRVMVAILI